YLWVHMKVGVCNRNCGEYDLALDNFHQSLNYIKYQNTDDQLIIQTTIYYQILKLFKDNLRSTEEYKRDIIDKISLNINLPIYDRLLIYPLIIDFMEELKSDANDGQNVKEIQNYINSNISRYNKTQLEKSNFIVIENYINLHETLLFQCIGDVLVHIDDMDAAIIYWTEILELKQQTLSSTIIDLIKSSESTFIEVYDEIRLYGQHFIQHLQSIIDCYEKAAKYWEKKGNSNTNNKEKNLKSFDRAIENYQSSLKVAEKMPDLTIKERINGELEKIRSFLR
ncbi:unnamed protein product, partial [Didymodactylos carnosus]